MHKVAKISMLAAIPMTLAAGAFANGSYVDPRLAVNTISDTQFEVIEGRGKGPRGIWCAASLHAINTLGIERGRIYIATPRGPAQTQPGKKGVVFSTQPVDGGTASVSVTVRQAGANLPVQHALQFCRDYDYGGF